MTILFGEGGVISDLKKFVEKKLQHFSRKRGRGGVKGRPEIFRKFICFGRDRLPFNVIQHVSHNLLKPHYNLDKSGDKRNFLNNLGVGPNVKFVSSSRSYLRYDAQLYKIWDNFWEFHSAHVTGPQQLLQITSMWSMHLRATHATNKRNLIGQTWKSANIIIINLFTDITNYHHNTHCSTTRYQLDRSDILDFLLDSCYCDLDMTIPAAT